MEQIEIIGKRKPREKHFLKDNGVIEAQLYDQDIHFYKNGKYEEIDNTLIKKDDIYENKNNSYKILFNNNIKNSNIYKVQKDNYYIEFFLKNHDNYSIEVINSKSKIKSKIIYHNILKNIDLSYDIISSEVKENIIINDIDNKIDDLCFDIKTNLTLKVDYDGSILATNENNIIFKFDIPYMIDSEKNVNKKISYNLIKDENTYQLFMFMDKKWLEQTAKYPVIIDPTITNYSNESSVIDTYIFPNDTNVTRGNLDYLKVGVQKVNNNEIINRALLKFDLPIIGTGSQVINAKLYLNNHPYRTEEMIEEVINVHRVTKDWNENNANWENMNNAYDSRIEGAFRFYGWYTIVNGKPTIMTESVDITPLVQKWYTSTPNYGILLKLSDEKYNTDIIPAFYSNNYKPTIGDSPKPLLVISYRNQNGLENYMNYEAHSFSKAKIYHNSYNGNLTTVFDIASTGPGKLPVNLKLIYNTNDVVLNKNIGYGIGYKFNLNQTIKEVTIDNRIYLEYEDDDGTLHYFLDEKISFDSTGHKIVKTEENTFFDEDGLELKIKKYDDKFVLIDKNSNEMTFTKYNDIGYLTQIKDVSGSTCSISYDSEYKKITSMMDANGQIILINYGTVITVNSPTDLVVLSKLDEKCLSSIIYNDDDLFISHNGNYLMTSLTNISGRRIDYEYYSEIPYKLKKVTEYGKSNSLGNSYTTIYDLNSTTFIDSKGRRKIITYNSNGNPESTSIMKQENDIANAYGSKSEYGKTIQDLNLDFDKNRLLSSQIPIKHVKNLLRNTSFENEEILFYSDPLSTCSVTDLYSHSGLKSLRLEAKGLYAEASVRQEVNVEKGKYYTFSAYVKKGIFISNAFLRMYYENFEGRYKEAVSESIVPTEDFERLDLTIFYPSDAIGNLNIEICLENGGTLYIDDVQLEEGEVVNNYNMIENSDFSNGINDWELYSSKYNVSDVFSTIDIGNQKALKLNMFTDNSSSISKTYNINGKVGEMFTLSFWYKNTGLVGHELFDEGSKNVVSMTFYPSDTEYGGDVIENYVLNSNENDWQYFICNFTADYDFRGFKLAIDQELNGNEFYITNINLFRDVRSVKYNYDENGNIISTKNLNDKDTNYKYDKNNELIKMTDTKGKIFCYEYDNLVTDRVIRGISETGISNEIEYDSFGNPIITRIVDRGIMLKPQNGEYIIRLKGTDKIIRLIDDLISVSDDYHSHDKWKLEKVILDDKDYYKIYHCLINNKYLTGIDDNIILSSYQDDKSLFELISQENGSYLLKNKSTNKYIKQGTSNFILEDLVEDDYNFQFYFETNENQMFIENNAKYTEDGRYITKIVDTNLNETKFDIDSNTNLIKSVTNPKNQVTKYNYNSKKQLESVITDDKVVNYEYNMNNTLSKIIQNNRVYNFEYDNFLNVKKIKIGDNIILVENIYEQNNGNLKTINYGNNQSISYEYDEFDRVKQLIKQDNVYNYKYNSNGDLSKIISDNDTIKYTYDLSKRLYRYNNGNFKIKYIYDDNNNVIEKEYELGNNRYIIKNTLNEDDILTKLSVDSNEFNYSYDGLGRLVSSNINGQNITNYKYKTNGKRTSNIVESIKNNDDTYSYRYDELGNIIKIYHNDILENEYYYDNYNELIKEDNYILNRTIKYSYDELGNILYKKECELKTDNQLSEIVYEYDNVNWKDQLTKYNGKLITYDNLGNPITIGENITLNWINGRQLSSYTDQTNTINYKYNVDGIRVSKTVNNVQTNYYLEGKNIIIEQTGENMIYYNRSNVEGLIGFKYNNEVYYYMKNNQDDIIGILDSNYNLVAKYRYDSWGNIISITDENDNDISNNNEHIANINPYRYRSYYYDKETKLYYLNSRYYNPRWGRFINADSVIAQDDVLKGNLFAYCCNNPINNIDLTGKGIIKKWFNKTIKKVKKTINNFLKSYFGVSINATSNRNIKERGSNLLIYDGVTSTDKYNIYSSSGGKDTLTGIDINLDKDDVFDSEINIYGGIGSLTIGNESTLNMDAKYKNWQWSIGVGKDNYGGIIKASGEYKITDEITYGGSYKVGISGILILALVYAYETNTSPADFVNYYQSLLNSQTSPFPLQDLQKAIQMN